METLSDEKIFVKLLIFNGINNVWNVFKINVIIAILKDIYVLKIFSKDDIYLLDFLLKIKILIFFAFMLIYM